MRIFRQLPRYHIHTTTEVCACNYALSVPASCSTASPSGWILPCWTWTIPCRNTMMSRLIRSYRMMLIVTASVRSADCSTGVFIHRTQLHFIRTKEFGLGLEEHKRRCSSFMEEYTTAVWRLDVLAPLAPWTDVSATRGRRVRGPNFGERFIYQIVFRRDSCPWYPGDGSNRSCHRMTFVG
nr:uncharacterized protein LOC115255569 [Aedes albopictus]